MKEGWTYVIDEKEKLVERRWNGNIVRSGYLKFQRLTSENWEKIKEIVRNNHGQTVVDLYSIARDELIERGLLKE